MELLFSGGLSGGFEGIGSSAGSSGASAVSRGGVFGGSQFPPAPPAPAAPGGVSVGGRVGEGVLTRDAGATSVLAVSITVAGACTCTSVAGTCSDLTGEEASIVSESPIPWAR